VHETDCRVFFYRKDPAGAAAHLELPRHGEPAREQRVVAFHNAGRWEATVFDHLAMFWA
jgi:hypothetical protein